MNTGTTLRHRIQGVCRCYSPWVSEDNQTFVFEELGFSDTPIGEVSLRKRTEPRAGNALVYEIKLDDEFLMSSLFTTGEEALSTHSLALLDAGKLDVVVGGLGLGYTAAAALDDERVSSLIVVDLLGTVIEWHRQSLVPLGEKLNADPRCRMVCGDFFALARDASGGFDHEAPGRQFDAILLDIDHAAEHWLAPSNESFYGAEGLHCLARHLRSGGVFGMWSNDPPDQRFLDRLRNVFGDASAKTVSFDNPYSGELASCTIYTALHAVEKQQHARD